MGHKHSIITLTASEKTALEVGHKIGTHHTFRRHCQAILLNASGKTRTEISKILNVCLNTLFTWFDVWKKNGITGLAFQPGRGRKPKIDIMNISVMTYIENALQIESHNLKPILASLKQEHQLEVSKKTLKRVLKKRLFLEKI